MLCDSLDRRGVWGRMDRGISMAEIITLLIGYTPIQNIKVFFFFFLIKIGDGVGTQICLCMTPKPLK